MQRGRPIEQSRQNLSSYDWERLSEEFGTIPAPRPLYRWFRILPDLALAFAAFTIFCCLGFFQAHRNLFLDADAALHLRNGVLIASSLTIPKDDSYSFTRPGREWVVREWGSDVLLGGADRIGGLGLVTFLCVGLIGAISWLWMRLNVSAGGNLFLACAFGLLMLLVVSARWRAGPHLFGWLMLLVFLLYLESAAPRFTWQAAALVALLAAVWANLHASFVVAPVIALIYAAGYAVRILLWNVDRDAGRGRAQWYVGAAAISLLAGLVNPYGLRLYLSTLEYAAIRARMDPPPNLNASVLIALAIAAGGGVLALMQKKVAHFGLTVALLAFGVSSSRALPVAVLVLLPLANGAITDALRRTRELRPHLRRVVHGWLQRSDRIQLLNARLAGWISIPILALLMWGWLQLPPIAEATGFPPVNLSVSAVSALAHAKPGLRIFATEQYGDYLIYRLNGRQKVFVDGRSDFYGERFLAGYGRLLLAKPGWQAQFEGWEITTALLPLDSALRSALAQSGWQELYRDDLAVLMERPDRSERQ